MDSVDYDLDRMFRKREDAGTRFLELKKEMVQLIVDCVSEDDYLPDVIAEIEIMYEAEFHDTISNDDLIDVIRTALCGK